MIVFTKRVLKVFFKDKSAVFFSLLSVFIIIALYALFLGDMMSKGMEGIADSRFLVDSWIMAGILAVTSVTATMGAFGIMIEDKASKIIKDFYSSPLKRNTIARGYILSAFLIGIIMSLVALVLAEIYILLNNGILLSATSFFKALFYIILSTLANISIMFFAISFFKSKNAFEAASTIVGTMIGFLTGIYIPIGSLPNAVQYVVKLFPPSHAAVLLRKVFMEESLKNSFAGMPVEARVEFEEMLGVTFMFGNTEISETISIAILCITAVVFFGLSVANISRKKR